MSTAIAPEQSADRNLRELRLYCFLMRGRHDPYAIEEILGRARSAREMNGDSSSARVRLFGIATQVCFARMGAAG